MKTFKILLLFMLILGVASCIDDLGSSAYIDKEKLLPITISELQDTVVVFGETLNITPTLENMDDESRYVFLWYASLQQTAGILPKRDTLSLERNLSAEIKMPSDTYNLVFEVRDPKLDIYVREEATMVVSASDIKAGWFILKNNNDEADFDYVKLDGSEIKKNVLKTVAGYQEFSDGPTEFGNQQLSGKAITMTYQNTRYYHQVISQNGTLTTLGNQRAYHIITDKNYKTFNSDNLVLFKSGKDQFYDESEIIKPQNIVFSNALWDLYLINNKRAYAINGMSMNINKYGSPKIINNVPEQDLHSNIATGFNGALVFDKISRSFFSTSSNGTTLNTMSAPPVDKDLPALSNMDLDLIELWEREIGAFSARGYCLMKSIIDDKYYLANMPGTFGDTSYPFDRFREVPGNAKMPTAQVRAVPRVASCVYFANDNVLSYYLDATEVENPEKEIYTFPTGEVVSFISNPKADTLVVLTNSASGWKLYGFPIVGTTPDIVPEPTFIYEGEGIGRYVMYRAS